MIDGIPVIRDFTPCTVVPPGGAWMPGAVAELATGWARSSLRRRGHEGKLRKTPDPEDPRRSKLWLIQPHDLRADPHEVSPTSAPGGVASGTAPPKGESTSAPTGVVAGDTSERLHTTPTDAGGLEVESYGRRCRTLDDLLEHAEIDVAKWMVERWTANRWESAMKGDDGEPRVVPLWQVKATLVPRPSGHLRPARTLRPLVPRTTRPGRATACCLVIPDTQHGFRWDARRRTLRPMHDRRAIDATVQLAQLLRPDVIVHLGDGPDFAEWSLKYPRAPELIETTQPAIDELHLDLRRWRETCDRMVYIEGNHGERVRRALHEKLPVAASTRAAGDDRNALDLARLLGLDQLDVEFVAPFGDDWYWQDSVRFVHDAGVKSKPGATVGGAVAAATHTTVFGHVHSLETASKTMHGPQGARTIYATTPGCLCRLDGEVPGVSTRPNWQQGCAVIWWDEDTGEHVQTLPIRDGVLMWYGERIVGVDRGVEFAEAIDWPVTG